MIKNIIFDLGGVILDLDFQRTLIAFEKLGVNHFASVFTLREQSELFNYYETGRITTEAFRIAIKRDLSAEHLSNQDFDHAWNAMLVKVPKERLDFIKELRKNFRTFLFSNTNEIHLEKIAQICLRDVSVDNFNDYFEREYYSCRLGLRKPDKASFEKILTANGLQPNETLFVDDALPNISGAKEIGLQTFHLTDDKSIFDIKANIT